MANTELIEENRRYNQKQIFIASFGGDYNLLIEADNVADADEWTASIKEHIKYANWENEVAVLHPDRSESRRIKAVSIEEEASTKCVYYRIRSVVDVSAPSFTPCLSTSNCSF